ncbi:MAG: M20 family metallopeptidase [Rhizobiaceae bacterium]
MTDHDEKRHALGLLEELVAAQAKGEPAVQARIAERLVASGCDVQQKAYDPAAVPVIGEFAGGRAQTAGERVNVIARLPGNAQMRSILVFAHPDSEPVNGAEGWSRDPFVLEDDGGRLHGWGVADDLAGIAAGALALEKAAKVPAAERGDIIFISAPSKRHARGVSAALHDGFEADAALYLHPAESGAGLSEIKALASGHLEFRILISGRYPDTNEPSHTAFSHLAENPLDKAFLIHAALKKLDAERGQRIHHPAIDKVVGRSTNLLVSNIACGEDRRFGRINLECTMGCALSFPPGETLEEVKAEVEAAIMSAAEQDAWLAKNPPRIEWVAGVTGAECPPDHPLYLTAARAVEAVTGIVPHVNPMHTSSDIRNPIVQKGIPTVAIGGLCGDLTQNGRTDEWVDRDDFLRMTAATTDIILGWCGTRRTGAN